MKQTSWWTCGPMEYLSLFISFVQKTYRNL